MKYQSLASLGAAPDGACYICHIAVGFGGVWGRGRTPKEAVEIAKRAARTAKNSLRELQACMVTDERDGSAVDYDMDRTQWGEE